MNINLSPKSLICFLLLSVFVETNLAQKLSGKVKNILFIMSDDLKASVLPAYGNTICKTPNIDQLAKSGMIFERAYCQGLACNPSRPSMLRSINPKSKKTEINTTSKKFKELYNLDNLKNIELEMSFDSGLLNFFGSKSIIKIYDRKLEAGKNTIKSKINIKAYAWGIRIKQFNYTVIEKLNEKGLLTFQKFSEADNSYFTINYK